MPRSLIFLALASLGLGACSSGTDSPAGSGSSQTTEAARPAHWPDPANPRFVEPLPPVTDHDFTPAITAEDFAAHVQTLASDEFEGRGPGGPGERRTVEYLVAHFERMGIEPGNDGSWVQTVPMVQTTAAPETRLTLRMGETERALSIASESVIGTRSGQALVELADAELVFVGFGINAPERGWNDYAGLDMTGKVAVIFVNDPGYYTGNADLFEGNRMTYYGRWTYKYEEAARQGAAGALIIHHDGGAGYGWSVVENSWSGPQFDLPASVDPAPRLPFQGWITADVGRELLSHAGLDLDAMYAAATQPGFTAKPLGASVDVHLPSSIREGSSDNVMGLIRGSARPDEVVVYMAHWDHLGRSFGGAGDRIYNGAVDNATGVAGVLEIAEAFASAEVPPERSVLFLLVALEESGLLGSAYYAANPVFPLDKTVGAINMDALQVLGPTRDFVVVGKGSSQMEDLLRPFAEAQGRTLVEESAPHAGYYFRSDHFNFAKVGVPALYAKGGVDHIDYGREYGLAWEEEYRLHRYHKQADHFDPEWDLRGTIQDLEALYGVGRTLAFSEQWPEWYEGNAFRAAREASLAR